MNNTRGTRSIVFILYVALSIWAPCDVSAGDKEYFGATRPGDWVEQDLTTPDGSRITYITKRLADDDGRVVVETTTKVIAGPGEGSESKSLNTFPADFNFARDWLSNGKFTEKMSMDYGGMVMPIDDATLKIIRDASKDYRGSLTFSGSETISGYSSDHYAYEVPVAGPTPSREIGDVWLSETIPFGVVRQTGKTVDDSGNATSSYELQLTDTGHEALSDGISADEPTISGAEALAVPTVVDLKDGYENGRVALDIVVVAGSAGRKLMITLRNKEDTELTVRVLAGELDLPADIPISTLRITIDHDAEFVLGPESSSEPIEVRQRGRRGPVDGKFTLSVYEGTYLFSGSVTTDTLR